MEPLPWVIIGQHAGEALMPSPADLQPDPRVRFDVVHVTRRAPVVAHHPEARTFDPSANGCSAHLPRTPASRFQERVTREVSRHSPHERIGDVAMKPSHQPAFSPAHEAFLLWKPTSVSETGSTGKILVDTHSLVKLVRCARCRNM